MFSGSDGEELDMSDIILQPKVYIYIYVYQKIHYHTYPETNPSASKCLNVGCFLSHIPWVDMWI